MLGTHSTQTEFGLLDSHDQYTFYAWYEWYVAYMTNLTETTSHKSIFWMCPLLFRKKFEFVFVNKKKTDLIHEKETRSVFFIGKKIVFVKKIRSIFVK